MAQNHEANELDQIDELHCINNISADETSITLAMQ